MLFIDGVEGVHDGRKDGYGRLEGAYPLKIDPVGQGRGNAAEFGQLLVDVITGFIFDIGLYPVWDINQRHPWIDLA